MSFWLLVLHLTVVSLATGQFVRPSSILESLKSLDRQQLGYRPFKAAVRSNWLSQRGSRSYGEHYDKRNLATKHEDQLVLQVDSVLKDCCVAYCDVQLGLREPFALLL